MDGRAIQAQSGETLAAALHGAGIRSLREAGEGTARGIFCGMGVCQECLVTVDGQPNLRACAVSVSGPHIVQRQQYPCQLPETASGSAPILAAELASRSPDVLVVGGGAGGLAAASIAAEAGLEVVLVDERARPGGQFYKQPSSTHRLADWIRSHAQVSEGRDRIDRARRAGVEFISHAEAWGAFAPRMVGVTTPSASIRFTPRYLIVAAGAYERGLPVPGWTLPGVMTTGAAQTLLKTEGVLAGQRVLVCGNGPLNLQVALELADAGAEIAAVAELAERPGTTSLGPLAGLLRNAPGLAWQGFRMMGALRRRRIPLLNGHVLASVAPSSADGLIATVGRFRNGAMSAVRHFEVDAVLMGYGFMPSNELLRALDCRHLFDEQRGHLMVQRDEDCLTSVAGVYGVGDCCGLGGAMAANAEGVIAGAAVVRASGRPLSTALAREAATARRAFVRHHRFQAALWRLFAAPRLQAELAEADTIICRCENVTLGVIESALADGTPTIGEVKRRTRLGMGRCQGRYCAPILASLLAKRQGRRLDELAFFAPRAPAKPVAIRDLVRTAGP